MLSMITNDVNNAAWDNVCHNSTFLDVMFLLCYTVSLCFYVCVCVLL